MDHMTIRIPSRLKNALSKRTSNKSEYIRRLIEQDMEGKIRQSERTKHIKIDETQRLGEILKDFSAFYQITEPVNLTIHPLADLAHQWQIQYLREIDQKHRIHFSLNPRQSGWDTVHNLIAHWFLRDKRRTRNILYLTHSSTSARNTKSSLFDKNLSYLEDEFNLTQVSNRATYYSNSEGNAISFQSPDDWLRSVHDIKEYDIIIVSEIAFLSSNFMTILPDIVRHVAKDPTKYLFVGGSIKSFNEQDLQYIKNISTLQLPEMTKEEDTGLRRVIINYPVNIHKKIAQLGIKDAMEAYRPCAVRDVISPVYMDVWEDIGNKFK